MHRRARGCRKCTVQDAEASGQQGPGMQLQPRFNGTSLESHCVSLPLRLKTLESDAHKGWRQRPHPLKFIPHQLLPASSFYSTQATSLLVGASHNRLPAPHASNLWRCLTDKPSRVFYQPAGHFLTQPSVKSKTKASLTSSHSPTGTASSSKLLPPAYHQGHRFGDSGPSPRG